MKGCLVTLFLALIFQNFYKEAKATSDCACTGEYDFQSTNPNNRGYIRGYCGRWSPHGFDWCYLAGNLKAKSCPGAKKSGSGDYYWTRDVSVCKDSLRLWEGGFAKVADGKSCNDAYTGKFTINTVGECAKTCSGTSTAFVYGKTEKICYCITGASGAGVCNSPYDNSRLDTYRYNGVWTTGFAKIADEKSCKDAYTYKAADTVGQCARICSSTSTVFVYGKTNGYCYCIDGASKDGVCSKPYSNSAYDTYRYDGVWESGFSKVAAKASCFDKYTVKSNKATVGKCASTCADTSTMFVYGTNNKQCYCINGATIQGECSDPFSNYALDTYRYNSRCKCTKKNTARTRSDYCGVLLGAASFDWCYLRGKEYSKDCPGATLGHAGYYWTKDKDICTSEATRRSVNTQRLLGLSFNKLDEGLKDKPSLATKWNKAQRSCLENSKCNAKFSQNNQVTNLAQVAHGFAAAKDIADGVAQILGNGTFNKMSKALAKLAPFMGAFGAMVNIVGLFGDSLEVQRLDKIMETLNNGFQRVEYRFDRLERGLQDLENTINEQNFWTRIRDDLATLYNAEELVKDYFETTDPAARRQNQKDLNYAEFRKLETALNSLKGEFLGKISGGSVGSLCQQAIGFTDVDRKKVTEVSTDIYNRMIKGVVHLVFIGKTLKRANIEQDEKKMTQMLKDVFQTIQVCDAKIKSSEWLKQWRTDLDGIIGDEPAGKEKQLADRIFTKLTAKYPWRDWLAVVYKDIYGENEHWVSHCWESSGYTVSKMHWYKRYNILVSSVAHNAPTRRFDRGHNEGYRGVYKAIDLYNKFPSKVKDYCTYPLKGVVTTKINLAIGAPSNRKYYWSRIYGHDYHYKWQVFVLG